jgi:hypothetical protein
MKKFHRSLLLAESKNGVNHTDFPHSGYLQPKKYGKCPNRHGNYTTILCILSMARRAFFVFCEKYIPDFSSS